MANERRVKGQDVTVRIARGNELQTALTAVRDFTLQYEFALVEQGYLGETTMRKDTIFNGVSGSFTIDAESTDLLLFTDFLKRRAQRKSDIVLNDSKVNLTATLNFPDGTRPRVLIPDTQYGAVPMSAADRSSYLSSAFSYAAEDAKIIST